MSLISFKINSFSRTSFLNKKWLKSLFVFMLYGGMLTPYVAESGSRFKIDSIQVVGLKGLSEKNVLYHVPVRVGDWFETDQADKIIKKLYATQWFKAVEVERLINELKITVIEQPIISKVNFKNDSGIPQNELDKILASLNLANGEFFQESSIAILKNILIQQHQSLGRYSAKVNVTVKPDLDIQPEGVVKIEVETDTGPTLGFASIRLLGTNAFEESRVLTELPIAPGYTIEPKAKLCTLMTRQAALGAIKTFYHNNGYYDVKCAEEQLSITHDRRCADWVVRVTEGPCYKIGRYRLLGETYGLSTEALNKLLTFQSGDTYTAEAIETSKKAIENHFGNEGYLSTSIQMTTIPHPETATLDLGIRIERGPKTKIRNIHILGTRRTKDSVLRRWILQPEGAIFSKRDYEDSKTRLVNTGLLEDVEAETVSLPGDKNEVDLIYRVQEMPRKTGMPLSMNWGGSHAMMQLDLDLPNWLGNGQTFSVKGTNTNQLFAARLGLSDVSSRLLGLDGVKWDFGLEYGARYTAWNMKSIRQWFDSSPYVKSMKAHGSFLNGLFFDKEVPENSTKVTSESTEKNEVFKIFETDYDNKSIEINLSFPYSRLSQFLQTGVEFKMKNYYLLDKKDYVQRVKDFVTTGGKTTDQWILKVGHYNNMLSGGHYFPRKGWASSLQLNLFFSGVRNPSREMNLLEKLNVADLGLDSGNHDSINYWKLAYSGNYLLPCITGSVPQKSLTLAMSWNMQVGHQFSLSDERPIPIDDAVQSGSFAGYQDNCLGEKDENLMQVIGGNALLKFKTSLILPHPFQGNLSKLIGAPWPYRIMPFVQVGNVYNLKFSDFKGKTIRDFPMAVGAGIALESVISLPMGRFPVYVSCAIPFSEAGNKKGFKEKYYQNWSAGIDFIKN